MSTLVESLAQDLKIQPEQVSGTLDLLKDGYAVPFVARYRKEQTGNLSETKVQVIADRFQAVTELETRRQVILNSMQAGGQLTDDLRTKISAAPNRPALEDLYLPYSPRTKKNPADRARDQNLVPLAEIFLKQEAQAATLDELAAPYLNAEKEVKETAQAVAGAQALVAERLAYDPEIRGAARKLLAEEAHLAAGPREGVDLAKTKYANFSAFREPVGKLPSHRVLAVLRGESEKKLKVALEYPREKLQELVQAKLELKPGTIFAPALEEALRTCLDRILLPALEKELRRELRQRAEQAAAELFGRNLRALLLQAPFGNRRVLAVGPARAGAVHLVLLDEAGAVVTQEKVYLRREQPQPKPKKKTESKPIAETAQAETAAPAETGSAAVPAEAPAPLEGAPAPAAELETAPASSETPTAAESAPKAEIATPVEDPRIKARATLIRMLTEHTVEVIAIGNGSSGRAADAFVREVLISGELPRRVGRVLVNEAGAAAFSSSKEAKQEFPKLELAARAAVSIGRRLQDPLAELVKLNPRFIGVGQYQHDLGGEFLKHKLVEVVDSCVNRVGVDLNKASVELLAHVSGLDAEKAAKIVAAREVLGGFKRRVTLKDVEGLGERAYTQAVGFLRIKGGENPLDNTAIHPERYELVEAMAQKAGVAAADLAGNAEHVNKLRLEEFRSPEVSEHTLKDIFWELRHPGRDPRGTFALPEGNEGVQDVADLKPEMVLNGVVTNLTAFGAFVDLGVHQDGLVHISELSHRYVRDPAALLTVGQAVRVKVIGIDTGKKRISLSIKALESAEAAAGGRGERSARPRGPRGPRKPREGAPAATGAPAAGGPGAPAGGPSREGGRGERRGAPAGRSGPGGPGGPGGRDGRPKRAKPDEKPAIKPEFAKFFDKAGKGKKDPRKMRKDGPRRGDEASRDEVRQRLRSQDGGGSTLGDLLKKAGLGDQEE